jgi:hypothetical protein
MKISITPSAGNSAVVSISCGTSTPKLSGSISISNFPNLTAFYCNNNDITNFSGSENCNKLGILYLSGNKFKTHPNLTNASSLSTLVLFSTPVTSIPNLNNCPELKYYNVNSCALSGEIPSFDNLPNLLEFRASTTNSLSGAIPALSGCPKLSIFTATSNKLTSYGPLSCFGITQLYLGGNLFTSFPVVSNLNNLNTLILSNISTIIGEIGNLSDTKLRNVELQNCRLSGFSLNPVPSSFFYIPGGVTRNFLITNNRFTLTATRNCLSAFYTSYNNTTAAGHNPNTLSAFTLALNGTNMPSPQGIGTINNEIRSYVSFLSSSPLPGWTITLGTSTING